MTGWRMGYLCLQADLLPVLLRCHQYSTTCSPAFIQVALAEAMDSPLTRLQVQMMLDQLAKRRELVMQELDEIPGLSYVPPQGAFYIMVDVRGLGLTGTAFSRKLLEEKYVATVPAIGLDEMSDSYVRFSYAASDEDLREGFRRIGEMAQEIRNGK